MVVDVDVVVVVVVDVDVDVLIAAAPPVFYDPRLPRRLTLLLALTACEAPQYDGRFPAPADVALGVPPSTDPRSQAHALLATTTAAVDHWLSAPLLDVAPTMQHLADHRETSRDGDTLQYGPFDDLDDRDLAWLVSIRLDAPTTRFAVNLGDLGATDPTDTLSLFDGHLAVDDDHREGAFTLDLTTLDTHRAISDRLSPTASYEGLVTAVFERDANTRAVDLAFAGFRIDDWSSDETWVYRRDADGWGAIDLALAGDLAGRSALRIELVARWREDLGGRVRATALDVDDIGDLVVDECFDAAGMLSYRNVSPVDAVLPGYAFGDERACVSTADELHHGGARSAAQLGRE